MGQAPLSQVSVSGGREVRPVSPSAPFFGLYHGVALVMSDRSKTTTDPETIRQWIEERKGRPMIVKGTESKGEGAGLLRIDFPGYDGGDGLEEVSWAEFFDTMERKNLALVYQEETPDGAMSRFNTFVSRDTVPTDK